MAGTVPTKGIGEARAQVRQDERRGGVAGDDHEIGRVEGDQAFHDGEDPADQGLLAQAAVGKAASSAA